MSYKNKKNKKKEKKTFPTVVLHVKARFNNCIITATDLLGNTICWSSSGANKFKGASKGTPYAAKIATQAIIQKLQNYGVKTAKIFLKGPGMGRDSAVMEFNQWAIVTQICDVTAIPFAGCRPKKRRRV